MYIVELVSNGFIGSSFPNVYSGTLQSCQEYLKALSKEENENFYYRYLNDENELCVFRNLDNKPTGEIYRISKVTL